MGSDLGGLTPFARCAGNWGVSPFLFWRSLVVRPRPAHLQKLTQELQRGGRDGSLLAALYSGAKKISRSRARQRVASLSPFARKRRMSPLPTLEVFGRQLVAGEEFVEVGAVALRQACGLADVAAGDLEDLR